MAVPTSTLTLNNFTTATARVRRPGLVDSFWGSAPAWAVIKRDKTFKLGGGDKIHENFIYTGMNASSYGRGTTFDTSLKEFSTAMVFNWKFAYSPVNLDVIDVDLNDSPEKVYSIVDATMQNSEISLIDDLSTQLFADGTGNATLDIDGLANGVSRSGSYGGITRGSTADSPGAAIRAGAEDTTGGTLSLSLLNKVFGDVVVGREKPNLLITTQLMWQRLWERSQPSERNIPELTRDIGFEAVRVNGAPVTVDSHTPTGFIYLMNMKWVVLYVHKKWDFKFRGFQEPANQQRQIGQLITWCNFVVKGPRFQGVMSGLT